MVVGPSPGEAHQPVGPGPVAVGEFLHVGEDVGLADPVGQLQAPLQAQRLGDHVEQLVDRVQPEEGEHARHLLVGMRDVGAHGPLLVCVSGVLRV